jgi:hypothetical protein
MTTMKLVKFAFVLLFITICTIASLSILQNPESAGRMLLAVLFTAAMTARVLWSAQP